MPRTNLVNAVDVALAVAVVAIDTTIEVDDASVLPAVPFYLVVDPFNDTQGREYMLCTAVAAEVLTVDRMLDGSDSDVHDVGDIVRITYAAQHLEDVWDAIEGIPAPGLPLPAGGVLGDSVRKNSAIDGDAGWKANVDIATTEPVAPVIGDIWMNPDEQGADDLVSVPTGAILPFGSVVAPGGFLLCDGAAIDRTTYADLFAIIGTNFGEGDASTTFNVPDLIGRFPLGLAASGVGSTIGEEGGSLTPTADLSHVHDIAHAHADTIAADSDGDHAHGSAGHDHTMTHGHPGTGNATVGGDNSSSGSSGVMSQDTAAGVAVSKQHTHNGVDSFSGDTESTTPGDTDAAGAHTHPISGGVTDNAGDSGSGGSATQALPLPAFLALPFIIKT